MSWKVVNTDMNYFIEESQNICLLQNHNELSAIPLPPAPPPWPLHSSLLALRSGSSLRALLTLFSWPAVPLDTWLMMMTHNRKKFLLTIALAPPPH